VIADLPAIGGRMRTRGHVRAVRAVRTMIEGRAPHALLIGGPAGIGKTTLALDLAAGLLCDDPDPAARPCRACRGCRLVDRGRHPDVHLLTPGGPGDQIRIGSRDRPEDGTVRRLTLDLALLPVEGGARVAIVERADRMGDEAQTALLKTLEEPPAGVTIVLCADDEDRLMPTVRSRCARIRLGPVAVRDVETILTEADLADPPLAARLARLAGGRPGLARSFAAAPDAVAARDELARTLLHLLGASPSVRLAAARDILDGATAIDRAMANAAADPDPDGADPAGGTARGTRGGRGRGRGAAGAGAGRSPSTKEPRRETGGSDDGSDTDDGTATDDDAETGRRTSAPAAQRRKAAATAVGVWREIARDLLVVRLAVEREIRDPAFLDDLRTASETLGPVDGGAAAPSNAALAAFLGRLDEAGELLEANVRPELVLDTLLLAWPAAR
jgi:DNA polymerase III delta' subunit